MALCVSPSLTVCESFVCVTISNDLPCWLLEPATFAWQRQHQVSLHTYAEDYCHVSLLYSDRHFFSQHHQRAPWLSFCRLPLGGARATSGCIVAIIVFINPGVRPGAAFRYGSKPVSPATQSEIQIMRTQSGLRSFLRSASLLLSIAFQSAVFCA